MLRDIVMFRSFTFAPLRTQSSVLSQEGDSIEFDPSLPLRRS
ncbi:hypothetical protein NC653_009860 [Populus alba x Populus x berolinensis]|uniref:Uncharacterized protein n=1 Tax=Populus alba x Populus x berolinensis TaxID=444605 RepID=A0AAD6RBD0_9ROSI|nr:hypothetical protein NC653_009860 [Populus alba x Populus x berolinensis]